MLIRNINKVSRLFQPVSSNIRGIEQLKSSTNSYDNLIQYGLIKQVNKGMYAYLPLALRVLNKLIALVDSEMEKIGAQKLLLPALTDTHLWKKTDRFKDSASELFTIQDRFKKHYLLSPTYEETICKLVSSVGPLSLDSMPLRLYQISNKWRDEMKPRLGFLRSREFLMKDLYTFDLTLDDAQKTYTSVCEAYDNIFKKIGVTVIKVIGDPGSVGGLMSHEYHYKSNIGDDIILTCSSCQYAINKTICSDAHCPQCKNPLLEEHVAEVGHTFLLDTKYTKPLHVTYKTNNTLKPFVMGCFGLGLSRIFAVMTEVLSTKNELRWPKNLAPYTLCIIPPKKGSKEETATQYVEQIIEILDKLNIDAVLDDRIGLTIGHRFMYACMTGFPYVIIIGRTAMKSPPLFEIHSVNNSTHCEVPLENIYNYFINEGIKN